MDNRIRVAKFVFWLNVVGNVFGFPVGTAIEFKVTLPESSGLTLRLSHPAL